MRWLLLALCGVLGHGANNSVAITVWREYPLPPPMCELPSFEDVIRTFNDTRNTTAPTLVEPVETKYLRGRGN